MKSRYARTSPPPTPQSDKATLSATEHNSSPETQRGKPHPLPRVGFLTISTSETLWIIS